MHFSRPGIITTIDKSLPRPSRHPRDINGLSSQSSRSRLSILRMNRFWNRDFFRLFILHVHRVFLASHLGVAAQSNYTHSSTKPKHGQILIHEIVSILRITRSIRQNSSTSLSLRIESTFNQPRQDILVIIVCQRVQISH